MRRSKPEIYVDILKVLALHGPLMLTHIVYKAKVNCSVLKQYLNFLIKQNLVEERKVGKKKVEYAITKRGRRILKCNWEEGHPHYGKIKTLVLKTLNHG